TCAADKAQANSVCSRGHRNNAIRRAFRRAVTDDEEIVIVVSQLVSGGEPLTECLAHRANQGLVPRLELGNKTSELPFGIRSCRANFRSWFHESFAAYGK